MDFKNLQWVNESSYEETENGIKMVASEKSDFFVVPEDDTAIATAPFLYKEVTGDFVFRAKVYGDFQNCYDACVLLAYENDKMWVKASFEQYHGGKNAVATIFTNGKSDDANNSFTTENEMWMQLSRKDDMFAVHFSSDDKEFAMARAAYMPMSKTIKVGFVAQAPMDKGGMRYFSDVTLVKKRVDDIRSAK